MFLFAFAVLVAVSASTVTSAGNETALLSRFDRDELRLVGVAVVPDADLANVKYLTYISDTSDAQLGHGVVVNKAWVITLTSAVKDVVANTILVTFDSQAATSIVGLTRKVKQNVPNPACTADNLVDCVSLLRFCPSITPDHAATLSPAITPYKAAAVAVHVFSYQSTSRATTTKALKYYAKKTGEYCECSELTGWTNDKHVCVAEDATMHGAAGGMDEKGVVVTNAARTEVLGFLVKPQATTGGGEIVLYLKTHDTWITQTAVVPTA